MNGRQPLLLIIFVCFILGGRVLLHSPGVLEAQTSCLPLPSAGITVGATRPGWPPGLSVEFFKTFFSVFRYLVVPV